MYSNKNLIELVQVDGKELAIERQSENCWVNLTEMAKPFGKRPVDWLKQQYVKDYLQSLADEINEQRQNSSFASVQSDVCHFTPITPEDLIIVRKGGGRKGEAGTWCTDYRIAMRIAQWLDTRFSVKVDTLLVRIANGELIVNDSSTFLFRGKKWISCAVYCKQFGKSMNSIFGLKAHYPYSFMYVDNQWYMNAELFSMKEAQARFENRRLELRKQHDTLQHFSLFTEEQLNGLED